MQRYAALLLAVVLGGCFGSADFSGLPLDGDPASLVLSEESLDFTAIGATQLLRATALTADGDPIPNARILWSSTDPSVATVDGSGLVTALAQGHTEILASYQGLEAKAYVRVLPTPKDLAGIEILPASPRLTFLGQMVQLRAFGVDAEGNLLSEILASWEVEDESIARVDRFGVLESLAEGETSVRATVLDGSLSTQTTVTVHPLPARLTFLDAPASSTAGEPQPGPIRVEARDAGGHRVTTQGLLVELAAVYGGERRPLGSGPLVDGVVRFEGVVVERAGEEIRLEARHEQVVAQSEPFRVVHAEPERLGFLGPFHPVEARVPFALRVGVTDAYGNPVPWERADIKLTLHSMEPADRTLSGGLVAPTQEGIATFELTVDGPAQLVFEAEAEGWPGATSEPLRARYVFTSLRAGAGHSCGLLRSGELLCFGANESGQLGLAPDESDRLLPTPVMPGDTFLAIEAASTFGCGITAGAEALCWGAIPGQGSWAPRWALPMEGEIPVALAAGEDHLCVLSELGTIRCLGENAHGQLGNGSRTGSDRPVVVQAPPAMAIQAGRGFTCALALDGTPWCWGRNDVGQLGGATSGGDASEPLALEGLSLVSLSLGGAHACGLNAEGQAFCWGASSHGQLGDGENEDSPLARAVKTERAFSKVAAGGEHSCGIDEDGRLLCWGAGLEGQLGNSEREQSYIPFPADTPFLGARFLEVSAGAQHSCAIELGGASYCWGKGANGRLGTGDTGDRAIPTVVEGTQP